jgi:polysaccharide export outer membrane protein
LLCGACVHHKELITFPEETTQFSSPEAILNGVQLRVQPDDVLRITVHSFDPIAASPFNIDPIGGQAQNQGQMLNQGGQGNNGNYTPELFMGYLVDPEGYINFPVVGRLKVDSLTIAEVEQLVSDGVKPYLKDGVVNARFLNFKITVLGEVNVPGYIRISSQRINMLEAIGLSGDFSPYANRTNVLLIREQNGRRTYERFNFQDERVISSPYFYLQQNDVLYVEPIKAKVATVQDPFARGLTYGTALLSVVTLLVALLR